MNDRLRAVVTPTDKLVTDIQEAMRQSGWTKKAIADRARLHPNTLLRYDTAGWNPALSTLRKLERLFLKQ